MSICIYLGITVVSIIASSFLTGYFNKKAENIATKQDVKDITGKIENIKTELSHISQSKLILANKQYEVLIEAYLSYCKVYEFMVSMVKYNLFIESTVSNNNQAYEKMVSLQKTASLKFFLVTLLNKDIGERFSELNIVVAEFRHPVNRFMSMIQKAHNDVKFQKLTPDEIKIKQDEIQNYFNDTYRPELLNFIETFSSKIKKLQVQMRNTIQELYTFPN